MLFGLLLAGGYKVVWIGLNDTVIENVSDNINDENLHMMPSKLKYRKELARNLQKHGLDITDSMLAELDV